MDWWLTMKFEYRESGDGYLARLEYSEPRTETTPKTRDRLLDLIKSNLRITREEMAGAVGISVNGVKKHIDVLKKEGVLSRVGDNRTGHWEIVQE